MPNQNFAIKTSIGCVLLWCAGCLVPSQNKFRRIFFTSSSTTGIQLGSGLGREVDGRTKQFGQCLSKPRIVERARKKLHECVIKNVTSSAAGTAGWLSLFREMRNGFHLQSVCYSNSKREPNTRQGRVQGCDMFHVSCAMVLDQYIRPLHPAYDQFYYKIRLAAQLLIRYLRESSGSGNWNLFRCQANEGEGIAFPS